MDSMMKLITQIYLVSAQSNLKYQSNDCNQIHLVFVFDDPL